MVETNVRRSARVAGRQLPRRYRGGSAPRRPPRNPVAPPEAQAEDGAENHPDSDLRELEVDDMMRTLGEDIERGNDDTQPQQQGMMDMMRNMMQGFTSLQNQMNRLNQLVENRSNSASTSTTASPSPAQPPTEQQQPSPTRRYAETPLEAGYHKPLDLENSKEDIKLYRMMSKEIMEEKIDLEEQDVYNLINDLKERSENSPWIKLDTGILIVRDEHDLNKRTNLLMKYGMLTLDQVTWHVKQYRQPPDTDEKIRKRQDDNALFQALTSSIESKAKNRLSMESDKYTVLGHKSGVLYFKVIIDNMNFDKHEMVSLTRMELHNIAPKLEEFDYDIKEFNAYVQERMERLEAANEQEDPMLPVNLFRAYVNTSNDYFNQFMTQELNDINHPLKKRKKLTARQVLLLARTQYDILTAQDRWKDKSDTQKALLSMQSQIGKFEKQLAKDRRQKTGNKGNGGGTKNPKDGKEKADSKPNRNPTSKEKKGEPFYNDGSRTPWYYCCPASGGKPDCNRGWVRHKPKECNPNKFPKKRGKKRTKSDVDRDIAKLTAELAEMEKEGNNSENEGYEDS